MREIAETVGVSKGLVYHYFDSKEELLAATLESRLDQLHEVLARIEEASSPELRLELLIEGLIEQVTADPEGFRFYLALSLEEADSPTLELPLRKLRERIDGYLDQVRDLFEELRSEAPAIDALLFRSALLGLCLRAALSDDSATDPEVRHRLLELFRSRT